MRFRQHVHAIALALVLALGLTACGGGGGDPDGSDAGVDAAPGSDQGDGDVADSGGEQPTSLATLDLVDPAAEFRDAGTANFAVADDGQGLDEGDHVRTDADGFAIIDYLDGSQTRLDRGTEFRVVAISGSAEAPQVRTRLDIGRAWNQVSDQAADGTFAVETAVGTAAVRGTIFLVECFVRTICRFAVVEGEVEVTPNGGEPIVLSPGEQLTVAGDEVGDVEPATATEPGSDGYVDRNHALDDGQPDPGGAAPGTVPVFVASQQLGDLVAPGDVVPLEYVTGGTNVRVEGECDDAFHLHSTEPEGITILGFGPFPDGPGCGYGKTNIDTEGPVGGRMVQVEPPRTVIGGG